MLCFVFVALLQCHPAGRPPHWLLLEGAGALDKCMHELSKCACMVSSAEPISIIICALCLGRFESSEGQAEAHL